MILITGGTGLLGAHLLYELLKDNENVRAIYRSKSKLETVKKMFSYYTADSDSMFNKIEWVQADINDIPTLTEAFKNVNWVYHCAALISFDPSDYHRLRKINIEGTHNIVNLCIENGVKKLCYVSSIAVIGKSEIPGEKITEDTTWNPEEDNNVYAITKYGAEMEVWRGTQEGVNAIIVNPGVILGSGFWYRGSGALFKLVKKGIPFYSKGGTGFVDVIDVAKIMTGLMRSTIKNERYIIISENLIFGDLFSRIANKIGTPAPRKILKPWLLQVLWRLDWLKSKLTGKKRRLTKWTVRSLNTVDKYSNDKVVKALDYKFTPMEDTLNRISNHFNS